MPTSASWAAWKKFLSCTEDAHISVHRPSARSASASASAPTSNTATTKTGPHRPPRSCHPKGQAAAPPSHEPKRRRSTNSSAFCNDLRSVVHGNTRVMHRGDQDSPLVHHQSSPHQLKVLLQEPPPSPLLLCSPRADDVLNHGQRPSCPSKKKIAISCNDYSIANSTSEPPGSLSPVIRSGVQPGEDEGLPVSCHKCGQSVEDVPDAFREHNATYHAVTELKEGDSARSIVEIIFQTSWLRQDIPCARPERIFRVHNSAKTVAKFEEYRETVKLKAGKISKKHSRCLVDGNELLRFHKTTVACRLGKSRLSTSSNSPWAASLCASPSCGVCQILKNGFPTKGQPGIYTNASSSQAHESFLLTSEYGNMPNIKHAMLICRVIAGRVKKSGKESSQDGPVSRYDSVAGDAGLPANMEELLVFDNAAVLPCFVVIYSH